VKKFLSNILILCGVFLLIMASYLLHLRYSPKKLAFAQAPEVTISNQSVTPVKLTIESAEISVPITPATNGQLQILASHLSKPHQFLENKGIVFFMGITGMGFWEICQK
jgi:hypothetical protein